MKMKTNILIIDGQGGRIGQLLIQGLKGRLNDAILITAVGTNSIATASMIKAGAVEAATGENPAVVACRDADIIAGPVGIAIADSLLGEVTPKMAVAVGQSKAAKVLIPMNKCDNQVVGVKNMPMNEMIAEAVNLIVTLLGKGNPVKFL